MGQDRHEEQSTVELICSGNIDADAPHSDDPFATGLYVSTHDGKKYLVTNWHVVTGRCPQTGRQLGNSIPQVLYLRETVSSAKANRRIPLYAEDKPVWIAANQRVMVEGTEQEIDLAIIPITTELYGIQFDKPLLHITQPMEQVTVIGYPYKRERPIWKTGHIAETVQPEKSYFLINGRTKNGMSGSGVFSSSLQVYNNELRVGNYHLIGIYSGRYMDLDVNRKATNRELNELDLGIVWKAYLIEQILRENSLLK